MGFVAQSTAALTLSKSALVLTDSLLMASAINGMFSSSVRFTHLPMRAPLAVMMALAALATAT